MLSIYRLPNKLPHEKVVRIIRKDVFVLFKKIVMLVVLIILPLGVIELLFWSLIEDSTNTVFHALFVLGTSTYYLFIWLFFFFSFIDYYLDVWIITNQRIIDIQQKGFFSRVISEQKLSRVQDVSSETHGVVATLLKYGDVHIQTAGTKQRFFFHEVPNPDRVRDEIIRLVEQEKLKNKDNKSIF